MARFYDPADRLPAYDENAFNEDELRVIIDMVRESGFRDDHSGNSIEDRLTVLFGGNTPEWVGFQTEDGTCYANCYGTVPTESGDDELDIQFELSDDLNSFVLSAIRINGLVQDELFISDFEAQFI